MGTLSFHLPAHLTPAMRWSLDRAAAIDALDLTPLPTRREVRGGRLFLTKDTTDSACVALPWPVADYGHPVIRTGTLRERDQPYHLLLELARGKLHQLRQQVADWERTSLSLDDVRSSLSATTKLLGRAAVDPSVPDFDELSEAVITSAYDLGDRAARAHADHTLSTRLAAAGPLPCHLSVRLARKPIGGDTARLADTFSAVRICTDWGRIEPAEAEYHWDEFDDLTAWAAGTRLAVSAGPLIDLARGIPVWLEPWVGDLPSLAAFMCDFAETVIRRYRPVVQTWEVFGGFNHADVLGLGEDDRLRLAARVLESCRDLAPDAQWVMTVTQPFGDYMAVDDQTYSPYVFADTLLRAGYRLAGINLDLRAGTGPDVGWQRDPLEVARLLEHFGSLGVPLEATFGRRTGHESRDVPVADPHSLPRWTHTSIVLSAATQHIRAVHWDPAEHSVSPSPTDATSPTLLHPSDLERSLSELRSYLA